MNATLWVQFSWAALLAGMLGLGFHRAWRWEHGASAPVLFDKPVGKETFILIPPTILFWILLLFTYLFMWRYGVSDGLARTAALAGDVMLFLCVYFLLLLALLPLLRKRISARACAVLWLTPAFLTWQGRLLVNGLPLPRRTIYVPRAALPAVGAVWLAGFLAVGGCYLLSHLRFRAWVDAHAAMERDGAVREIWKREREALEYRREVTLLRADVPTPFSMGRTSRSRCTVLPLRDYTPEELTMIFRHELHHLQRRDVDTKVFLCMCNALCWFNPLVWIATKKAAEDLERSCDEIVAEEMDAAERKRYAKLLLSAAGPGRGCTTCLSAAADTLRYRLKSIVDFDPRARGTLLLMAAVFLCAMGYGTVSFSDAHGSFGDRILPEGTEVRNVIDTREGKTVFWHPEAEAIRAALEGLELEHVAGLRNPVTPKANVTFVLDGGHYVTLTDGMLLVKDYHHFLAGSADCWIVRSAVDWEKLDAALSASEKVE